MLHLLQITARTLATLPAPPVFTRVLFESPIVAPVAAAAVGLVIAGAFLRKGNRRVAIFAMLLGVVGAFALAISSRAVTTPREEIEARTRELVDLIVAGDQLALEEMLSDRLSLRVDASDALVMNPKQFTIDRIDMIKQRVDDYNTKIVASIADTPVSGRVRFAVRAGIRDGGINFTVWLCEWRRDSDDQWRLYGLDWKKLNGKAPVPRLLPGIRTFG